MILPTRWNAPARHPTRVGPLNAAGAAGAGRSPRPRPPSPDRQNGCFRWFSPPSSHRGCDLHQLDFLSSAAFGQRNSCRCRRGKRLGFLLLFLAQISRLHHGLCEVEGGGIVQANDLSTPQSRSPKPFGGCRADLLEDRKSRPIDWTPTRGRSSASVVDIAFRLRRLLEWGGTSLAIAALRGLAGFSWLWAWCARSRG